MLHAPVQPKTTTNTPCSFAACAVAVGQVSATLLGEPDLGLLTPPEMARKAGQIVYSIPGVPVLVDADTGDSFMQFCMRFFCASFVVVISLGQHGVSA
jgi:2-methylisocitrate lyase-like PEP mutase family enzyme